jgi:hypothetical protein
MMPAMSATAPSQNRIAGGQMNHHPAAISNAPISPSTSQPSIYAFASPTTVAAACEAGTVSWICTI